MTEALPACSEQRSPSITREAENSQQHLLQGTWQSSDSKLCLLLLADLTCLLCPLKAPQDPACWCCHIGVGCHLQHQPPAVAHLHPIRAARHLPDAHTRDVLTGSPSLLPSAQSAPWQPLGRVQSPACPPWPVPLALPLRTCCGGLNCQVLLSQLLVQQDLVPEALHSTLEEWVGCRRAACCTGTTAPACLLHQQRNGDPQRKALLTVSSMLSTAGLQQCHLMPVTVPSKCSGDKVLLKNHQHAAQKQPN